MIDPCYCVDGLIISSSVEVKPTPLMSANHKILNRITAIQVAISDGQDSEVGRHLEELIELLDSPNVNFTEFTSFFPTLDVSYSIYKKLDLHQKKDFLDVAVRQYIEKRHSIYQSHGYTATTLQVRKDFEKHKTGGNAANVKFRGLLAKAGYSAAVNRDEIINGLRKFLFLDDSSLSQEVLGSLRSKHGLKFDWQREHQGKSADMIFVDHKNDIFICEFKHMKEGGGGQDKQVSELISLISFKESNPRFGYISFLDGIYFNSFVNPVAPKPREQVRQIRQSLSANPKNYFVNTWGIEQLISS